MSKNITCKQAVDYISKKEEGKLTAGQRFQLWRHLAICSLCRLFARQNKLLTSLVKKNTPSASLSEAEKEAIIDKTLQ